MHWWHAVLLGVVQGLTEFLPVSSSAHLLLVPKALGWPDPGAAFTAVIQLGTMLAVLIYFASDIRDVAVGWVRGWFEPQARKTQEYRMGWIVVAGTVPISIVGLLLRHTIEHGARNVVLVGCALIVGGIVLEACDRVGASDRDVDDARLRDGILIGLAQTLALVPGVSRSGATISAGRLLSFERTDAARLSFLLSIPAVVLSGLFELPKAIGSNVDIGAVIIATMVSFIVGYASIAFLLRWLGSHRVTLFSGYRLVLGVVVLLVVAIR